MILLANRKDIAKLAHMGEVRGHGILDVGEAHSTTNLFKRAIVCAGVNQSNQQTGSTLLTAHKAEVNKFPPQPPPSRIKEDTPPSTQQHKCPAAPNSMTDANWEISKMPSGAKLLKTIGQLKNPKLNDADRQILLAKRLKLETEVREQRAFSKENFAHFTNMMLVAAEDLGKVGRPHLRMLIDNIKNIQTNVANDSFTLTSKNFTNTCKKLREDFYKACAADGIKKEDMTTAYKLNALQNCESAWKIRKYNVALHGDNGSTTEVTCKITPQLDREAVDKKMRGRTSNDKSAEHLVNRWHSEMKIGDKVVLSISRHACTRGKGEATKELIASSLSSTASFSEKLANGAGSKDNPFALRLSNIQLMSPSRILIPGDKDLPFKQMDGIRKLVNEKQPVEISIENPMKSGEFLNVWVNLEPPLLFNFGCDAQAFIPVANRVFFKSDESDRHNAESMRALFGSDLTAKDKKNDGPNGLTQFCKEGKSKKWNSEDFRKAAAYFGKDSVVGKYLLDEKNSARDKRIVTTLSEQITDIWRGYKHRTETTNQYAIQERLIILSNKLNYATSVNCKSGKDRTGAVCSTASALAAEIEMSGENPTIPDPYKQSIERRLNTSAMFSASGSLAITKDNTGVEGLKIPEVDLIGLKTNSAFGNITLASKLAQS
jgi:hypothetical protein